MDDTKEIFGEVIHSYTRAEAIADGYLVDLTTFSFRPNLNVCQEVGIKFPIAITRAAYERTIQEDGAELPPCQDISGRMFDVVNMLRFAIRRSAGGSDVRFVVSVRNWIRRQGQRINATKQENIILKALCGPGDDGEPVITIMLPDED